MFQESLFSDADPKKFDVRHSVFNGLVVKVKLKIWVRIVFQGDDHNFGFVGISLKEVGGKPIMNVIDVFLEVSEVLATADRFVLSCVISIQN